MIKRCTHLRLLSCRWLGSRVISVLDSGAVGPGSKSQPRRCRVASSLTQTVHTHRASVPQAATLVAALLKIARITAGLAESNRSLPPGLWLTSPSGWLPRTWIGSRTLRSVSEYGPHPQRYGLPLLFLLHGRWWRCWWWWWRRSRRSGCRTACSSSTTRSPGVATRASGSCSAAVSRSTQTAPSIRCSTTPCPPSSD